jgi:hypothetical protein
MTIMRLFQKVVRAGPLAESVRYRTDAARTEQAMRRAAIGRDHSSAGAKSPIFHNVRIPLLTGG